MFSAEETPKRIVIYSPFPDIKKQETFNLQCALTKENDTYLQTDLPLQCDMNAKSASWKSYRKHVDELNEWKKGLIKKFGKLYTKKGYPHEFVSLNYPDECQDLFSNYHGNDLLFVHSHGNPKVIGTGPFVLMPQMLAENLDRLGLNKSSPPVIVVWACNSGSDPEYDTAEDEIGMQSYASELRKELKKRGFNVDGNLLVIGIAAKINNEEKITFTKETDSQIEKTLSQAEAVKLCYTPRAGDDAIAGGVYSAAKQFKTRKRKHVNDSELQPQRLFSNSQPNAKPKEHRRSTRLAKKHRH